MIKISQKENRDTARAAAAAELSQYLRAHHAQPILLLVSGGSALHLLDAIDHTTLGKNITLNVIDERYGVDKEHQNFYQLSQLSFAQAFIERGGILCDAQITEAETIVHAGELLEGCIHDFYHTHKDGRVVVVLGIGADGHTVGVMPYPEDASSFDKMFIDTPKDAIGYDAGQRNVFPLRVTVTLAFLRDRVDHAVVYATGNEKQHAIARIMHPQGTVHETPARILREMKSVVLYTDQEIKK